MVELYIEGVRYLIRFVVPNAEVIFYFILFYFFFANVLYLTFLVGVHSSCTVAALLLRK